MLQHRFHKYAEDDVASVGRRGLARAAPVGIGTTDANGWYVDASPYTGKRVWRRRDIGVATTAVVTQVQSYSLPVGVATMAAVDVAVALNVRSTGRISTVPFVANVTRDTTATDVRVDVTLVNLANLTTAASTIDIFVTLEER